MILPSYLSPQFKYNYDVTFGQETAFYHISKHRQESWKYDVQTNIFDMSWAFDIYSQLKPKLKKRGKQRSTYACILNHKNQNYDQIITYPNTGTV